MAEPEGDPPNDAVIDVAGAGPEASQSSITEIAEQRTLSQSSSAPDCAYPSRQASTSSADTARSRVTFSQPLLPNATAGRQNKGPDASASQTLSTSRRSNGPGAQRPRCGGVLGSARTGPGRVIGQDSCASQMTDGSGGSGNSASSSHMDQLSHGPAQWSGMAPPAPEIQSDTSLSQTVVGSETVVFRGLRVRAVGLVFFHAAGVLSLGLLYLLVHWMPWLKQHALLARRSPLSQATHVHIQHMFAHASDIYAMTELQSRALPDGRKSNEKLLHHRGHTFLLDPLDEVLDLVPDVPATFGTELEVACNSIPLGVYHGTNKQHADRQVAYGQNFIEIPNKNPLLLAWGIMWHPFFVFQYFSVIIWIWLEYYTYSFFVLAITWIAIGVMVVDMYLNSKRVADMAKLECQVTVVSSGHRRVCDSVHLVPGDVVEVKQGVLPADMVLVSGECVVDESLLTGESYPVRKVVYPQSATYHTDVHSSSTMRAGTVVLQVKKVLEGSPAMAMISSTGLGTAKGSLLRSIIYPKQHQRSYYLDALYFVGFMGILGMLMYIVSVVIFVKHGFGVSDIILKALDMITVAVPPALPACIVIASSMSIWRLRRKGIYSVDVTRINLAGVTSAVIFDKTGTLTCEEMRLESLWAASWIPKDRAAVTSLWGDIDSMSHDTGESQEKTQGWTVVDGNLEEMSGLEQQCALILAGEHRLHIEQLQMLAADYGQSSQGAAMQELPPTDNSAGSCRCGPRFRLPSTEACSGSESELKLEKIAPDAVADTQPALLADVMACCNGLALIGSQVVGDPLDLALFKATGWVMNETLDGATMAPPRCLTTDAMTSTGAVQLGRWATNWRPCLRFDFSPATARATVVMSGPKNMGMWVFTKGSPEKILELCEPASVPPSTLEFLATETRAGKRLVALACRPLNNLLYHMPILHSLGQSWFERGLCFLGIAVLESPLKEGSQETISSLHKAELRTVMMTGDHINTAVKVAHDCGMLSEGVPVLQITAKPTQRRRAAPAVSPRRPSALDPTQTNSPRAPLDTLMSLTGECLWKKSIWLEVMSRPDNATTFEPGRQGSRRRRERGSTSSRAARRDMELEMAVYGSSGCDIPVAPASTSQEMLALVAKGQISVAVSGRGMEVICRSAIVSELGLELLDVVLHHGVVFARMSPIEKEKAVELLCSKEVHLLGGSLPGLYLATLYVGDGSNDIKALQTASVGLALCKAEASVAAALTSQRDSVDSVLSLISEGRCSVAVQHAIVHFIMCYAWIQVLGTNLTYLHGVVMANPLYVYQDLVIVTTLALSMSCTHPRAHLEPNPPPLRVLRGEVVVCIVVQLFIISGFQMLAKWFTFLSPEYLRYRVADNAPLTETEDPVSTTIFLVTYAQLLIAGLVFNVHSSFRQPIYRNILLVTVLSVLTAVWMVILFIPHDLPILQDHFSLSFYKLSYEIRYWLFLLCLANLLVALLAHCTVVHFARKKAARQHRPSL